MNLDDPIERLIERFYNGETSLEEEKQLQNFFQREDIPDHLKTYKTQFFHLNASKEVTWKGFSEEKLFGKLEARLEPDKKEMKTVKMPGRTNLWWYRIAAAVALILVGYFAADILKPGRNIEGLKDEIEQMKAMMMDQMSSTSASGRLQAVGYAFKVSEADDEMLNALIKVAFDEKNMNVRMKAIEALARFGEEEKARSALIKALGVEKEPVVQIVLIDVLVKLREKGAVENLQKIVDNNDNLKEVKDEAHLGIFKLREL